MAGSVNKVILIGNVGKDPEIRSTQDGKEIATLSLATSESWKDRNTGERKEKTEWHRVAVLSDGLVSVVKNYVKKGSKLYIEGQLKTRKWTDQNGQEKYSTEVVLPAFGGVLTMLEGRKDGGEANDGGPYSASPGGGRDSGFKQGGNSSGTYQTASHLPDDDIPF